MTAVVVPLCELCGLGVYLPESSEHPCCAIARSLGEPECVGCETFRRRWQRGETCPHASRRERACCTPSTIGAR